MAANQTFIALGNFMTAAAMGGSTPARWRGSSRPGTTGLGLSKRGLAASIVCGRGYRTARNKYAT